MNLIDLILLAIALGIDCLVVSFSQGLIFNTNRLKSSLQLALVMGVFSGWNAFNTDMSEQIICINLFCHTVSG